jgi:glutathione S-transferase
MKLYVFPVAPNPTRLRLYIYEKNAAGAQIEVEEVIVNLRENEQRNPEHLTRNPLGKLPVLENDDGSYITESLAIIHYLEDLFPEPSMIGRTPLERARTLEIERIAEIGVLHSIARIVHTTNSPLGLAPNPAVADYFRELLPVGLTLLDEKLSDGRPFLLGESPTIADFTLQAALQFGRVGKIEPDPRFEHLARWNTAFRERPSAQAILLL